jgi:hypothetical protein
MSVAELQELEEVKALLAKGQQIGVLTFTEIATATSELDLDESDVEELHGIFENSQIELVEEIDPATTASNQVERLAEPADVISRNPVTIQLRYLQTLLEIGSEQNSTIVFPLPIDLIGPLMQAVNGHDANAAPPPPEAGIAPDRATNGPPTGAISA